MTTVNNLGVAPRGRVGKGGARTARREGTVPAVIYGNKQPPIPVSIDLHALTLELAHPGFMTRLFDFSIEGRTERCLCRAIQRHPVNERPLHVDFLRVGAESRVHVRVPVHFTGQDRSPGLKRGGVLNIVAHEVELICNAAAIPEALTADLSGLDIGHSLHLETLAMPAGAAAAAREGGHLTIATIVAPTVQAAEEKPAAEAATDAAAAAAVPAAGGEKPGT